jgi:pimeloyl-ACP methyl ester carboxylesterase
MNTQHANDLERQFNHRKDVVNGVPIHSVVGGSRPAVVLLHGWPQTWWEWRHVMPPLAKHFTVIAPDLRGFGDSGRPPPEQGYDVATVCSDLDQLLKTLNTGPVRLVLVRSCWRCMSAAFRSRRTG